MTNTAVHVLLIVRVVRALQKLHCGKRNLYRVADYGSYSVVVPLLLYHSTVAVDDVGNF